MTKTGNKSKGPFFPVDYKVVWFSVSDSPRRTWLTDTRFQLKTINRIGALMPTIINSSVNPPETYE